MTRLRYLHDLPHIRAGLDGLLAEDPVFAARTIPVEQFGWQYIGAGFAGLIRIIIGQQISTSAADALWLRFETTLPAVTPAVLLDLSDADMRGLGMSQQKMSYMRGLAAAVADGSFDPHALEQLDDAAVYAAITACKGLGNWSAEMFLMFGLARPDVWPAGDLGIQEGLRRYRKQATRPDYEETRAAGADFAGRRTAAALLLWHLKSLPPEDV